MFGLSCCVPFALTYRIPFLGYNRSLHLYEATWNKYDRVEATWEPQSHFTNTPNILADYLCGVKTLERSEGNKHHHRGCWRGFTTAIVHSYGKGIARDGFAAIDWELHVAHPFRPLLITSGSYAM